MRDFVMAQMFTLGSFARFLVDEVIVNADTGRKEALEVMAKAIKSKARGVLGTHEYGWPPLEPETIARKATGDSPLLETGEMRDSIDYTIIEPGKRAEVGSNSDIAVFMELGTERVPARSFLAQTGARHGKAAAELAGAIVAAAIADRRVLGGELRELFHVLHKFGHSLREDAKELLDEADKDEGNKK
jgi:hypothetical protein